MTADEELKTEDINLISDKNIIYKEKIKIINKTINRLPEKYKKLLKLRYEDVLH